MPAGRSFAAGSASHTPGVARVWIRRDGVEVVALIMARLPPDESGGRRCRLLPGRLTASVIGRPPGK